MSEYEFVGIVMASALLLTVAITWVICKIESTIKDKRSKHRYRQYKKLKLNQEYAVYTAIASTAGYRV